MWHLIAFALASITSGQNANLTFEGVPFGAQQSLTCTWFTNFENSRLEQCWAAGKRLLPSDSGASIKCVRQVCDELDTKARKAAAWRKPEPPWGTFTVTLVGRVSPVPHTRQYLGDGTSTVLIEKVLRVRKSS
jgi:hypothetical protein